MGCGSVLLPTSYLTSVLYLLTPHLVAKTVRAVLLTNCLLFHASSYINVCNPIPIDMDRGQAKSNVKDSRRQPSMPEDHGKVFRVTILDVYFELMICRNATPRNQETANPSQKLTPASNPKISQATINQDQSCPGTSLPSSKQHPGRQKRMSFDSFCYYTVALTHFRYSRVLRFFHTHPCPLESGNKYKKNRKLNIPLPKAKSNGPPSDGRTRLRVVSTRRNHSSCRRLALARAPPKR